MRRGRRSLRGRSRRLRASWIPQRPGRRGLARSALPRSGDLCGPPWWSASPCAPRRARSAPELRGGQPVLENGELT
eukprot:5138234-Alexandrium_andersonii.AAC.1